MSTVDLAVVAIAFIGATLAAWQQWSVARTGWSARRGDYAALAVFTSIYALSYLWLLIERDPAEWSHWLRPVGMVQWYALAWHAHAHHRRLPW